MEERIISSEAPKTKSKYVPWGIFTWIIGIIFIILGWVIWAEAGFNGQLVEHDNKDLEIQTQLSQIQTDLNWIRKALDK